MLLIGVAWDGVGRRRAEEGESRPVGIDLYSGTGRAHGYVTSARTTLCGRDVRTLAWTPFVGHAFEHVEDHLQCGECVAALA